jgi:hypothetical protein
MADEIQQTADRLGPILIWTGIASVVVAFMAGYRANIANGPLPAIHCAKMIRDHHRTSDSGARSR